MNLLIAARQAERYNPQAFIEGGNDSPSDIENRWRLNRQQVEEPVVQVVEIQPQVVEQNIVNNIDQQIEELFQQYTNRRNPVHGSAFQHLENFRTLTQGGSRTLSTIVPLARSFEMKISVTIGEGIVHNYVANIGSKIYNVNSYNDIITSFAEYLGRAGEGSDVVSTFLGRHADRNNRDRGGELRYSVTLVPLYGTTNKPDTVNISFTLDHHVLLHGGYSKKSSGSSNANCAIIALNELTLGALQKKYEFKPNFCHLFRMEYNISPGPISFDTISKMVPIVTDVNQFPPTTAEEREKYIYINSPALRSKGNYNEYNHEVLFLGQTENRSMINPRLVTDFRDDTISILVFTMNHVYLAQYIELVPTNLQGYYIDNNKPLAVLPQGYIYANNFGSKLVIDITNTEAIYSFWSEQIPIEILSHNVPDSELIEYRDTKKRKNPRRDFSMSQNAIRGEQRLYEKLLADLRALSIDEVRTLFPDLTAPNTIFNDVRNLPASVTQYIDQRINASVSTSDRFLPSENLLERPARKALGLLMYDIETYPDNSTYYSKGTVLRDCLLCIQYIEPEFMSKPTAEKLTHVQSETFITTINEDGSYTTACRKFLNWLSARPHSYAIYGHNAANFDTYFVLQAMSDTELLEVAGNGILRQNSSYLQFSFKGSCFKDSCKFLTAPLSSLAKSFFPNNPEWWKTADLTVVDPRNSQPVNITSVQLCFFGCSESIEQQTSFETFITTFKDYRSPLQNVRSFWSAYEDYCMQDVNVLLRLWLSYTDTCGDMDQKMLDNSWVIGAEKRERSVAAMKMSVTNAVTTGNHNLNRLKGLNQDFTGFQDFMDACSNQHEIYSIVDQGKVGGMSISNMRGLFTQGVIAYDAKSLYPACLLHGLYASGKPTAISQITPTIESEVNEMRPALLRIKDLKFKSHPGLIKKVPYAASPDGNKHLTYKPILEYDTEEKTLLSNVLRLRAEERTWVSDAHHVKFTVCSSFMLYYLKEKFGLYEYTIVDGVFWEKWLIGYDIFGSLIQTCYTIKQDEDNKKDNYANLTQEAKDALSADRCPNPALREACKLAMNSLTGKLGQSALGRDTLIVEHDTIANEDFTKQPGISTDEQGSMKRRRFATVAQSVPHAKTEMTIHMVFLYEFSKMIMFNYIHDLLQSGGNFIAVETDSLHFESRYDSKFTALVSKVERNQVLARGNPHKLTVPSMKYLNIDTPFAKKGKDNSRDVKPIYTSRKPYVNLLNGKLQLFPFHAAGPDVQNLGQFAIDKTAQVAIYIGKKKYALRGGDVQRPKWLFRLAGFRASTINADGSSLALLKDVQYAECLLKSTLFQEHVRREGLNPRFADSKEIQELTSTTYNPAAYHNMSPEEFTSKYGGNSYCVTQEVKQLKKVRDTTIIVQTLASKSVKPFLTGGLSPLVGTVLNGSTCNVQSLSAALFANKISNIDMSDVQLDVTFVSDR